MGLLDKALRELDKIESSQSGGLLKKALSVKGIPATEEDEAKKKLKKK